MDNLEYSVFKCIEAHETEYAEPLELKKGEIVRLGQLAPEENWKDWIWAENKGGSGGWVPLAILTITDSVETAEVIDDYSSKELNIDKGESVFQLKTLANWSWVVNTKTKEEGWVPNEKIAELL